MKYKINKLTMRCIGIMLMVCFFLPRGLIHAEGHTMVIQDSENPIEGIIYKVWQLSEEDYQALNDDASSQLASNDQGIRLNQLSIAQLDQEYPRHYLSAATDSQGRTSIDGLAEGVYYGLALNADQTDRHPSIAPFFAIIPSGEIINPKSELPSGDLEIIKRSTDNQQLLPGVVFQLFEQGSQQPISFDANNHYSIEGIKVDLVTDSQGSILLKGLPKGKYLLKEVKALPGFKALDLPLAFEFDPSATPLLQLEVMNTPEEYPTGGYKFRKVDANNTDTGLEGAVFKVLDQYFKDVYHNGELLTLVSGPNGYFELTGLPYGQYYLVEINAPKLGDVDYKILDNPISFIISADSYLDATLLAIKNEPIIVIEETTTTTTLTTVEVPTNPGPPTPPKSSGKPNLPDTGEQNNLGLWSFLTLLTAMLFLLRDFNLRSNFDE